MLTPRSFAWSRLAPLLVELVARWPEPPRHQLHHTTCEAPEVLRGLNSYLACQALILCIWFPWALVINSSYASRSLG